MAQYGNSYASAYAPAEASSGAGGSGGYGYGAAAAAAGAAGGAAAGYGAAGGYGAEPYGAYDDQQQQQPYHEGQYEPYSDVRLPSFPLFPRYALR